ncbi:casein kinase [Maudiozyma humilis]|uniref:non-specific serine/threonine protein kinase n=1 Tax=Maudiozyma humilis TaxID=51915 RepID=A0AAV5RSU7_MAUHU|nr:casein kinase [Kazachstania humilis]
MRQHIVGIHYALGPKIGEGSFGVIFEGENLLNKDAREPVAIKFEPRNSDAPQLRDEFRAYRILNDCRGIPHAYYYGQEGMHNVLVIDLLGPSLEDLFEWCGRRFSVKTTCLLARQMIDRVREIHEHDLIYRDIKPDNFLIAQFQLNSADPRTKQIAASANGDPNLIYMVDFGMAKQYRDPRTKQHIPYRERKSLSGTARYMSINTHFGREQSRRDDLESLGHVFFYFLRGSLPWQGLKAANNKLKYEKIGLTKQKLDPSDLLMNGTIPPQFATYLKYVRALKFEEEPDYKYLIGLIEDVMDCMGIIDDGHYDWMDLNNGDGWNIAVNKRANLHGYGNPTPRQNNSNANNGNRRKDTANNNNRHHATTDNNDTAKLNRISSSSRTRLNNMDNSRSHSNSHNNSSQDLLRGDHDYNNYSSNNRHQYTRHHTQNAGAAGANHYDSMGTRNYIPNNGNANHNGHRQYDRDNFTSPRDSFASYDQRDGDHDSDDERGCLARFFSSLCCCCCCC